ncbi:MAG: electron transfer flavoprotein subunit alpha/FixB family protein [bacterium]
MANILIYSEINDGAIHDVSLQSLARARELAAGGRVTCLAVGSGVTTAAQGLFAFGADEVHVADDARLNGYLTTPYSRTVAAFLGQQAFDLVLFPASTCGNDLAPSVASILDAACVLDATNVVAEGGKLLARRTEFDRKVATDYAAMGGKPMIVTLKDGVAATPSPDASRTGTVKPFAAAADGGRTSRIARRDVVKKTVNLKDAQIIVGVGAGVGAKENFTNINEFAGLLGAQIGATRAIVDAGWLPADHQIGQTGATVRPGLYIACGISGAVQHWVGMSESRTIVAINTDKAAPIMKRAHYRITGDVNTVVPKLIKLLKK